MEKTPKQVTEDILNSLRIPNAPEGILLESYLEAWERSIKKKLLEGVYQEISENTLKDCEYLTLTTVKDILNKHGADINKIK